jgi:hypothetical protein
LNTTLPFFLDLLINRDLLLPHLLLRFQYLTVLADAQLFASNLVDGEDRLIEYIFDISPKESTSLEVSFEPLSVCKLLCQDVELVVNFSPAATALSQLVWLFCLVIRLDLLHPLLAELWFALQLRAIRLDIVFEAVTANFVIILIIRPVNLFLEQPCISVFKQLIALSPYKDLNGKFPFLVLFFLFRAAFRGVFAKSFFNFWKPNSFDVAQRDVGRRAPFLRRLLLFRSVFRVVTREPRHLYVRKTEAEYYNVN